MKQLLCLICVVMSLASCSTTKIGMTTRGTCYPKMYQENPITLLVMPPINKTTHVEAKEYFYTSLAQPLCEKGYYVISPFLAMDFFKEESAYNSEMFINGSLEPFHKVFGADAVLFTTINTWTKTALAGIITVNIEYELRSAKTNESLFKRKGEVTIDTNTTAYGSSGWGALANLASSAIHAALTDKVIAAQRCNIYVLEDLPTGKYSPQNGIDATIAAGSADFKVTLKQ